MPFASLIGQDEAKKRLGAALTGIPGHAYVITGPGGVGNCKGEDAGSIPAIRPK